MFLASRAYGSHIHDDARRVYQRCLDAISQFNFEHGIKPSLASSKWEDYHLDLRRAALKKLSNIYPQDKWCIEQLAEVNAVLTRHKYERAAKEHQATKERPALVKAELLARKAAKEASIVEADIKDDAWYVALTALDKHDKHYGIQPAYTNLYWEKWHIAAMQQATKDLLQEMPGDSFLTSYLQDLNASIQGMKTTQETTGYASHTSTYGDHKVAATNQANPPPSTLKSPVTQKTATATAVNPQAIDDLAKLASKLELLEKRFVAEEAKHAVPRPMYFHDVGLSDADFTKLEKALDNIEIHGSASKEDVQHISKIMDNVETQIRQIYRDQPVKPRFITSNPALNQQIEEIYREREATMPKYKSGWVTDSNGVSRHYNDSGALHNEGSPAEIRTNGTQLYYRNGALHREGGSPAMIGAKGTQKFAVDGKYHRLGGLPAITWSKGPYRSEWWENGEILRAQTKDGIMEYYAPGCNERDTASCHRVDGPAVVYPDGRQEFWLNGRQYSNQQTWLSALEQLNKQVPIERQVINEEPIETVETTRTTTSNKVSTSKEKPMTKPSFTDTIKANAITAGYRVGATQMTSLVKNAVLAALQSKGTDDGALKSIKSMLDTELGDAFIAFAIGSGLIYVPKLGEDERVQRLAEEMRVNGMATAGNMLVGETLQHLFPAVMSIVNNLPAVATETANNVRVIESTAPNKLAEALEEDEQTTATTDIKTMKA